MTSHCLYFDHPTFWAEWQARQPISGVDEWEVEESDEKTARSIEWDWKRKRGMVGLWFGDEPEKEK